MSELQLAYRDLSFEAMVKISEIADLLGVTPKRAKEIYLVEVSRERERRKVKPAA